MKNIATALVLAQSEMSNPVKQATNPFFKSKYSDLNSVRESILPILNKHKISVLQPICQIDGKNYVKTLLLHESGETLESNTEIIFNKMNDAQAQGSGISYARRYGLQSFLCVGADDDDGNKASEAPKALPTLVENSKEWEGVFKVKDKYSIADFRKKYQISDELAEKLK